MSKESKFEKFEVKMILLKPHKPWRGKSVLIHWPGWKHPLAIHIYPHTEYDVSNGDGFDKIIRYEVSWSALGSVPVLQARRYAHAINMAASEAKLLEDKYVGKDYK